MRFFICEHCKNIITFVEDSGVPVMCCGQKMTELVANTTDAAQEKHVPVVEKDGDKLIVSVGSVEHPMTEEHHIAWIAVETKNGSQIKYLDHTGAPKVEFALGGEDVEAVYAYCTLHGLWKALTQQESKTGAIKHVKFNVQSTGSCGRFPAGGTAA